jgi:transcription initiation factor TFIIF subunit beta
MANDNIIRTPYQPRPIQQDRQEAKDKKQKKLRKEKEEVLDILFAAFMKHQFYNLKDLIKLTQQPSVIDFFIYIFIIFNQNG